MSRSSPARWGGHHIAMGTNTDPYQRSEGKYLTLEGGPLGGRQLVNRAPDSTEGSAAPDGPPG